MCSRVRLLWITTSLSFDLNIEHMGFSWKILCEVGHFGGETVKRCYKHKSRACEICVKACCKVKIVEES